MNASELRKKKILTNSEISQIIHEIHPVIINKVDYYFTITDFSGLQTSHLNFLDTVVSNNQELIDNLPPDRYVNKKYVDLLVGDQLFVDKNGRIFQVLVNN